MVGLVVLVICVHDGGGGDHVVDVDCDVTEQTGGDLQHDLSIVGT